MNKYLITAAFTALSFSSFTATAQDAACDSACLANIARDYMAETMRDNPSLQAAREFAFDVVPRDFSMLPWGERVRFT